MRTGFFPACAGALALLFLAAPAPALRAQDGGGAPPQAPSMQDYQDRNAPAAPVLPSSSPSLDLMTPPPAPAPTLTKPEDDNNWLQKGVDDQRKANDLRAAGKAPDSPLKPVDPLAPAKPLPMAKPTLQTDLVNDPAKLKPVKGVDGTSPLVPAAPKAAGQNQLQPLIQGLSSDATKPLATGTTTNAPSALSGFKPIKAIEPVNPDVTRPLYLDKAARGDTAPFDYGSVSAPDGAAPGMKLPSGYEVPNAPGSRSQGAAPIAISAPGAPTAPRPSGGALSAFAPIQPIQMPTPVAPIAPVAPTARDLAPKAGPGSAMKLKDPVSADLPFIR